MDAARSNCVELRLALSLGVRCAARLLEAGLNPDLEADVLKRVRAIADDELTITPIEDAGTGYGADQVARVVAAARRQDRELARRILGRDALERARLHEADQ